MRQKTYENKILASWLKSKQITEHSTTGQHRSIFGFSLKIKKILATAQGAPAQRTFLWAGS